MSASMLVEQPCPTCEGRGRVLVLTVPCAHCGAPAPLPRQRGRYVCQPYCSAVCQLAARRLRGRAYYYARKVAP